MQRQENLGEMVKLASKIKWFVRVYKDELDRIVGATYWVMDTDGRDRAVISTAVSESGKEVIEYATIDRQKVPILSGSSVDDMQNIMETFLKAEGEAEE